MGWYKILFILTIFEDVDYINYIVRFGKTMWTFWYIFYIVLSKSLHKTTQKLPKLFSVYITVVVAVFIFQVQTRPISVVLLLR